MRIANCLLVLFVFLVSHHVQSQDLSDLRSVNVDQLSDAQVQQFLDKAKESGMTLDQLEVAAQTRGMPASQISKLRNRIRALQLKSSSTSSQIESSQDRLREDNDATNSNLFETLSSDESPSSTKGLKVFGLDIFKSSTSSFIPSQNVATPENYVLGAGDELIIDVYGASEITYQQTISPDGKILISGVGPIPLAGITVQAAKIRIFNKLSTIYSGMKGINPNTFMEISLGGVRSITVNVVGNVTQPGSYTLTSFSTVFNALYNAGGPAENGSMRRIELLREGKVIANLDIYQYLFQGNDSQNLQLQNGDVVVVKPYINRVKLAGEVKNPAIYELENNQTLNHLLEIAGGFSEMAFRERIVIDRIGKKEKEVVSVNRDSFDTEVIQNGDSIFIAPVLDTYRNRVKIQGAVKRPGYFELTSEMTLSVLLSIAEGLRDDAYLKRGNIIRLSEDLSLKNISFDIELIINGDQDLLLSANDLVIIPSIFDIEEKKMVTIDGRIRNPGEFPFTEDMTVEDLIALSGGLLEDASTFTIEVARRLKNDEDLSKSSEVFTLKINEDLSLSGQSNIKLKPYDLVLIKSTPFEREQKVVKIEGEVNLPGLYALESHDDKLSDLIKRAGGLTEYGFAEGAMLIRQSDFKSNDEEIREEARLFRAQQLSQLLYRDSIDQFNDIEKRQAIGIELEKALAKPGSLDDLILRDGDLISIPQKLETVRIQGEVLYPNAVRFIEGTSLKSYVSAAGGFTANAKIAKSYVVYANGSAKRTKSFLFFRKFPRLKPGADIIIPQKPERRRMTVQEVLGITSSLATIALIIDRLSQ